MKTQKIALEQLKTPERNVRMHTEAQLKEFERSVEMFGQIRPIVCDEDLTILAGNGLYETLKRMGKTEADVLVISNLTENQKKKLMLADNRIYSLGVDDLETLDAFLIELDGDLDIPGFDQELLIDMVSDTSEITEKLEEYGSLDPEEVQSIQAAGERQAQAMTRATQPEAPHEEGPDTITNETEAPGRYVICPACGEKIWL